jgi:two-component system, sensor histidine kinase LadS
MKKILLVLILGIAPLFSQSENIITIEDVNQLSLIGKSLYFLEDPSGNLTIDELKKEYYQNKFSLYQKDIFTFPSTKSKFWFKVLIRNQTNEDSLLEVGSLHSWFIDFYEVDETGKVLRKIETGTMRPVENKIYQVDLFWLPVNQANKNESKTFYLNIWGEPPMDIPIQVGSLRALYQKKTMNDHLAAGFVGIMFIMLLYNLFIFVSTKDFTYLYYIGYILFSIIVVPFVNNSSIVEKISMGFIPRELWYKYLLFFLAMLNIFIAFFTISYFDLKKKFPLGRIGIFSTLFIISFIYPCLIFLNLYPYLIQNSIQFFLLLFYFVCIGISFYMLYIDFQKARYYVIGWVLSLCGTIVFLFGLHGILPFNIWTRNSTYFGFAFEVLFFSLALADRINTMRREKEEALSMLISKSIENQNLISKQNEFLESQVSIRTMELKSALTEIKQDLNFAKRIQSKILPLSLTRLDKLNINSRYIPMEEVGGDYFDIFKLNNDCIRVFIADATGHGVQAALITMLIKSEYEGIKESFESHGLVLETINNVFLNKYMSLNCLFSCFIVDIDVLNNKIKYSSAGHPNQLLIKDKNIIELSRTGRLIGLKKQSAFQDKIEDFEGENKLLLYTDGLFEEFNLNEEEFGEERILKIVESQFNQNIDFTIEELLKATKAFLESNVYQDDITIIGIELNS